MSGVWGNNIRLAIFGESHGKAIGISIDGLPPGLSLDLDEINHEMQRRAPGRNNISTQRKEKDQFEILSGYFNGRTTGTPLMMIINNKDTRSRDYEKTRHMLRPGHGDYSGHVRYKGFNDYRGGGHFSGRLTAPIVFAGAVAKQLLKVHGITIGAHIYRIGDKMDTPFDMVSVNDSTLRALRDKEFAVIEEKNNPIMKDIILKAKEEQDSVGGIVETAIINIPAGLGRPFFDSVESKISSLAFSIPSVKGIEFGMGFDISKIKGSKANDSFCIADGDIKTRSNNNGGINGGITNGMPIIYRVAIKPTPSIAKAQTTVDIRDNKETTIEIEGRHDPCIVPRVVPVMEAIGSIAILDLMLEKGEWNAR